MALSGPVPRQRSGWDAASSSGGALGHPTGAPSGAVVFVLVTVTTGTTPSVHDSLSTTYSQVASSAAAGLTTTTWQGTTTQAGTPVFSILLSRSSSLTVEAHEFPAGTTLAQFQAYAADPLRGASSLASFKSQAP